MYYSGMPFNVFSEIETINFEERYFKELKENLPFCHKAYEGILQNNVDLVIYLQTEWNDNRLALYHLSKYGNTLFYTYNEVGNNVYKVTSVEEQKVTGYQVLKYDKLWRVDVEQVFDNNFLLLEYRQMVYSNELSRIAHKEKIFFSSWHISEESFE